VPQRFLRNYGNRSAQHGVIVGEEVTMQKSAIKRASCKTVEWL
jgi:hypothetical protein